VNGQPAHVRPVKGNRGVSSSASLVLAWLAALACGGGTPQVKTGPHPESSPPPLVVQSPPPPTKIEVVPLRRNPQCFWQGGHWTPRSGGWKWVKGAWILPPDGCTFAPAVTRFESLEGSTVLVHRPQLWYREAGTLTCAEPKDCSDL
jgi:hypothetical protein